MLKAQWYLKVRFIWQSGLFSLLLHPTSKMNKRWRAFEPIQEFHSGNFCLTNKPTTNHLVSTEERSHTPSTSMGKSTELLPHTQPACTCTTKTPPLLTYTPKLCTHPDTPVTCAHACI